MQIDEENPLKDSLEEGEQLLGVYKPEFVRFLWGRVIFSFIVCLWWAALCYFVVYVICVWFDLEYGMPAIIGSTIAAIVVLLVPFIVILPLRIKEYHETYYGYSAKHIFVRQGVFKAKTRFATGHEIIAAEIGYQLGDKVFKRNTGTVKFTTRAGVNEQANELGLGKLCFYYVEKPYETLSIVLAALRGETPEEEETQN